MDTTDSNRHGLEKRTTNHCETNSQLIGKSKTRLPDLIPIAVSLCLLLKACGLPQQRISGVSDFMAMIIVMVLITQNAFMGSSNPVTTFIIMDCSEQAFPAVSYFMAMLVVVIGICSEQTRAAVSDLVTMLVIMIRAIRQDARATEDLLHGFRLLSKQRREQETGPCPQYMKACSRF